MSYELAIHPDAEREWGKLDETVKKRFRQKLQKERLINPRVAKDALHGLPDVSIDLPHCPIPFFNASLRNVAH